MEGRSRARRTLPTAVANGRVPVITAPCDDATIFKASATSNGKTITLLRPAVSSLPHCWELGLLCFVKESSKTARVPAITARPMPTKIGSMLCTAIRVAGNERLKDATPSSPHQSPVCSEFSVFTFKNIEGLHHAQLVQKAFRRGKFSLCPRRAFSMRFAIH